MNQTEGTRYSGQTELSALARSALLLDDGAVSPLRDRAFCPNLLAEAKEWRVRIITIINQKGGCGKTTTAINLAAGMAKGGLRTLLVDLDPQSHCAVGLGIPENRIDLDIGDVLVLPNNRPIDTTRLLWRVGRNLDLAPSRMKLAGLEAARGGLADKPDKERRLAQVLERLKQDYDVALIDCSPAIGLLTFNALAAANSVLIPVETGFFALQGATRQLTTVKTLSKRLGAEIPISFVPTLHDDSSTVSHDLLGELQRRFGHQLAPIVIRRDSKLREAASFGQPAIDYAPDAPGTKDYLELARWVAIKHGLKLSGYSNAEPNWGTRRTIELKPDAAPTPTPTPTVTSGPAPMPIPASNPVSAPVQVPLQAPVQTPAAAHSSDANVTIYIPTESTVGGVGGVGGTKSRQLEFEAPITLAPREMTPGVAKQSLSTPAAAPVLSASEIRESLLRASARTETKAPATTPTSTPAPASHAPIANPLIPTSNMELDPTRPTSRAAELVHRAQKLLKRVTGERPEEQISTTPLRFDGSDVEVKPQMRTADPDRRLLGVRVTPQGVLFVQPASLGERVSIAGSFNNWSATSDTMRLNPELGIFEACVQVPPGTHQYRLVVDGQWTADPHNTNAELNPFGELNSVVTVQGVTAQRMEQVLEHQGAA